MMLFCFLVMNRVVEEESDGERFRILHFSGGALNASLV
jgi:hypothetical protein